MPRFWRGLQPPRKKAHTIVREERGVSMSRGTLAVVMAITCALQAVSAQSPTVLRGHVRVAGDTTSVPLATVELEGVSPLWLTDSTGAFRITGVAPGKYRLRVRRLGYYPVTQYVDVARGDSADVLVAIKVLPKTLNEIVISGKLVSVPWRFEDVYRRASSGFGHFITREEIEQRNPSLTRDLLNGVPGIVTYNDMLVFQKCRKKLRGGPVYIEGGNKVQVYIDGRRFTIRRLGRGGDGRARLGESARHSGDRDLHRRCANPWRLRVPGVRRDRDLDEKVLSP